MEQIVRSEIVATSQKSNDNGLETAVPHPSSTENNKYRGLFEATPISLWEEDFSEVKIFIDQLHAQGVKDFRAYFDAHPEDVFHCIGLVKVRDVNQATLELYKAFSKEQLLENLDKVFGSGAFGIFKEELILISKGDTSFQTEGINYTLDNEELIVSLRWSVTPGFEESFSQVIISIVDITEQRRAEKRLQLQATALESAANAITITNDKGIILWVNSAFTKLTGYLPEEVIGKNPRILKSGKNSEAFYHDLWQTVNAGKVWHCEELINRRKDGTFYYERMTITPVPDKTGQITRFIAIKEDVSERKQSEIALKKERDFAHQVMDNMEQGLAVVNAGLIIEYCNDALAQLVGSSEKSLVGQSLFALVQTDEQQKMLFPTKEEYLAGRMSRETEFAHANGSQVNVLISAVARGERFDDEGSICVVTDRSAQVKIENALAAARDEAIEASRLKSEFLANMSHEIRTPLNAVIGMTSLMLDSELTDEQQDFAQTIRSSGEVLLALINDILDFSKIEAGKLELEQRPFAVRDSVEEALDVVVTKAAEKGLELAYVIDDTVPNDISGDVTRVRQILVNLLNNAIKFTKIGEIVLTVSRDDKTPADSSSKAISLQFSVQDTGIGIPPKKLGKLFQSFSQVDASTTREYGGTGLGLAISKQLVEMMGGRIWVESEYGTGSTFHFTISTNPVASKRRIYMQKTLPQLEGKNLLIVDDNKTNCKIMVKQAELWGMNPQAVLSGAEALVLLRQGTPFDLAILDMQMPEMDGIMLAAEIRKLRDETSLPLVMLSSIGDRDDFKESTYFAAFLTKPIKQKLLFDTLLNVFSDTAVPIRRPKEKLKIDPEMSRKHPLRILLAEDNLVNQKVALRILERMGYRADLAGDGLEVLESLQRQPYDVILMDVQMPHMDGVEATEQIRDIWPPKEQPDIIAMTANALTGDRERYLAAGMDNYISKPVRIQELLQALAEAKPLSAKQKS